MPQFLEQNATVELTFYLRKSRFTGFQVRFSASRLVLILFCEIEHEIWLSESGYVTATILFENYAMSRNWEMIIFDIE